MTFQQIVNAKRAIDGICKMQFPIKKAYQLFKMRKKIDELFEFEVGRETQVVEKYHGEISSDGKITFQSADDGAAFADEMKALLATECEEVIEPIEIDVNEMPDMEITPEMMWQLEGFINFL